MDSPIDLSTFVRSWLMAPYRVAVSSQVSKCTSGSVRLPSLSSADFAANDAAVVMYIPARQRDDDLHHLSI